ncbi:TolC family protein [Dysgonomonas termitidis]|uniref:TolC family protein n=1 Tax=Dysgonomonas termitidis TaxID=1516126 RepID=A0ABV9KY51_9BACT
MKKIFKYIWLGSLLVFSPVAYSQSNPELDRLIEAALANNKELSSYQLQTQASKAKINTAFDFDKTTVYYGYDENNVAPNDRALRVFGIEQTFSFPTVYSAQKKVYKSQWEQNKALYEIQKNKLALAISLVYEEIVYTQNKEKLYTQLDSLYSAFSKAGSRKFELGESNYLEKITAEAKSKQIYATLIQLKSQRQALYEQLKSLIQSEEKFHIGNDKLSLLYLENTSIGKELQKNYMATVSNTYNSQLKLQNQNWLPDLSVELFTGTNKGLGYRQNGFQIGVAIPLFFSGNISRKKTAKLEQQSWEAMRSNREIQMEGFYMQKQAELNQHKEMINYYTDNGQMLSEEIIKTADMSYKNGEIDFFQYIQSMENAIGIESGYLDNVLAYNKSYLELHYFNFNE